MFTSMKTVPIFVLAGLSLVNGECSADVHHPGTGYYVEGINGLQTDADLFAPSELGLRQSDNTWEAEHYYPHGDTVVCDTRYCSEDEKLNGRVNYIQAHTCAAIRFEYKSTSGSTVYAMKDETAFEACDFSTATLVCDSDAQMPCDYMVEDDHVKQVYYFASKDHCGDVENPQKVAVNVADDYVNNAGQCNAMGYGSRRIQHCDCKFQLRPSTLVDPCHTQFVAGCLADMPDDDSCCPGDDASYDPETRQYINGGTCMAKSKHETYWNTAKVVNKLPAVKQTVYDEMEKCPSRYSAEGKDYVCEMYKAVKDCKKASTKEEVAMCETDLNWLTFTEVVGIEQCSVETTHPTMDGYYTEGINGLFDDEGAVRDEVTKKFADDSRWMPNNYYPHGEYVECTRRCSDEEKLNGTPQYIDAHTCAAISFEYSASSGSTVYEMKDLQAFESCDFEHARLVCSETQGSPCQEHIDADHVKKIYYYASKDHCADTENPQKVAVEIVDDFINRANKCKGYGEGNSRIQHCDCDFHLRSSSIDEPCHTPYVEACMADMPDDTSCCPGPDAKYDSDNRQYVNGGTCLAKSEEEPMAQHVKDVDALTAEEKTAYEALEECPSRYSATGADAICEMYKSVVECKDSTGPTAIECQTNLDWLVYKDQSPTMVSVTPETTDPTTNDDTDDDDSDDVVGAAASIASGLAPVCALLAATLF